MEAKNIVQIAEKREGEWGGRKGYEEVDASSNASRRVRWNHDEGT